MKRNYLLYFLVFLFVATQLGDIITTMMVTEKHQAIKDDLEINPMFVLGIPLEALYLLVLGYTIYFTWFMLRKYYTYRGWIRYFFIYFLVFIILLKFSVCVQNYSIYQLPTEDLHPIPIEDRIDEYNNQVADMQLVQSVREKTGFKLPLAFDIFIYNYLIFLLWYWLELYEKKWKT